MEDIEVRLHAAYKKVDYFPEERQGGFIKLLALRKLVPEAVQTLAAQRGKIEKLEARIAELETAIASQPPEQSG